MYYGTHKLKFTGEVARRLWTDPQALSLIMMHVPLGITANAYRIDGKGEPDEIEYGFDFEVYGSNLAKSGTEHCLKAIKDYASTRLLKDLKHLNGEQDEEDECLEDFDLAILNGISKRTLYIVARQLGALTGESCDDLAMGSARIIKEWSAQFLSGNVKDNPCEVGNKVANILENKYLTSAE